MIKTSQQTSYESQTNREKKETSHNAKWLVPPFYVREINYAEKKKKNHDFLSRRCCKKPDVECKKNDAKIRKQLKQLQKNYI